MYKINMHIVQTYVSIFVQCAYTYVSFVLLPGQSSFFRANKRRILPGPVKLISFLLLALSGLSFAACFVEWSAAFLLPAVSSLGPSAILPVCSCNASFPCLPPPIFFSFSCSSLLPVPFGVAGRLLLLPPLLFSLLSHGPCCPVLPAQPL